MAKPEVETEDLTRLETEHLLSFFRNHMSGEQRNELMHTLPRAYNRWVGRKIMATVNTTREE